MKKPEASLLSCLPLLFGCGTSELLIDVSGLDATIDQLDVFLTTPSSMSTQQMVSKRISVSNVKAAVNERSGHYKLTLDHSLTLSDPGRATIYVGAFAGGCLRGVGTAEGELRPNNDGFATLEVPVSARMQANQTQPCSATNPVVTSIEISHVSTGPNSSINEALVYGWGFAPNSQVYVKVTPSRTMAAFEPVNEPFDSSEYLPDRLRLPLGSATSSKLLSILTPDLPMFNLTFQKELYVINPGPPRIESAIFAFK